MACATLKRSIDWESMPQLPAKRRRCPQSPFAASSSTSPKVEPRASAFEEAISGSMKMTLERLPQQLRDEIKRLQRRRQLRVERGAVCSSSSGSEGDCSPPHHSRAADPRHQPLFTFKQLRVICEKMLSEQERALRAEYETVLRNKLAEQYEAFVRFNLDQVQRRPPPAACMTLGMDAEHMHQDLVPSYLS